MAADNVLINNLCGWPLYFKRITGMGDIEIPANAKRFPLISHDEAMAQIQTGNIMFVGTDQMGNHARIQIIDDEQRKELFGIEGMETTAPALLDLDAVKALLSIKSKTKFNDQLQAMVKTDAEKKMLVDLAFQAGAEDAESWKVDALRNIADSLSK